MQRFNNQDVLEARATLKLDPTDRLTNSTILTWHGDKNRGSAQLRLGRAGAPIPLAAVAPSITGNSRLATLDTDLSRPRSSTWAAVNTTVFELSDDVRLKNIFSYIHAKGYGNNPTDVDGSAIPAVNLVRPLRKLRNRQLVEELH